MRRRGFYFIVIFLCFAVGYQILILWQGILLSQTSVTEEGLLEAIRICPENPQPYYKLAILSQWGSFNADLARAADYLRTAIERNPLEQEYWLNLARICLREERAAEFERALGNALLVFPTGYRGRWAAGNLFLQYGFFDQSLSHFSYILNYYPNQSSVVYDVLGRVVRDSDFVLEQFIPENILSLTQYLAYLYGMRDRETLKRVWKKRETLGYKPDPAETFRHVEYLISEGDLRDAHAVWQACVQEQGDLSASNGNLVTNSGFEREKLWPSGFDWRLGTAPGAEVSFDRSIFFEGKRSLRIRFNGKENVDFAHVSQYVAWTPNTEYLLKACVKTEALTTKNGIKLEITGIGPAFRVSSSQLTGDNNWQEVKVPFRTPASSQGGVLRIRRERSTKFDKFIAGTAWIDDIQITEK